MITQEQIDMALPGRMRTAIVLMECNAPPNFKVRGYRYGRTPITEAQAERWMQAVAEEVLSPVRYEDEEWFVVKYRHQRFAKEPWRNVEVFVLVPARKVRPEVVMAARKQLQNPLLQSIKVINKTS